MDSLTDAIWTLKIHKELIMRELCQEPWTQFDSQSPVAVDQFTPLRLV